MTLAILLYGVFYFAAFLVITKNQEKMFTNEYNFNCIKILLLYMDYALGKKFTAEMNKFV